MSQKRRMQQHYDHAKVYLLEGDLDAVAGRYKCPCGRGCLVKCSRPPITLPHVLSLMDSLADEGFVVVKTKGFRDTISWLHKASQSLLAKHRDGKALRGNIIREAIEGASGVPSPARPAPKARVTEEDDVILLSPGSTKSMEMSGSSPPQRLEDTRGAINLLSPDSADDGDTDPGDAPPSGLKHRMLSVAKQLEQMGFEADHVQFAMDVLERNDLEELRSWLVENVGPPASKSSSSANGKARVVRPVDQLKAEGFVESNISFAKEVLQTDNVDKLRSWLTENVGPPNRTQPGTVSSPQRTQTGSSSNGEPKKTYSSPMQMPLKCEKCGSSMVNEVGYCWDCAMNAADTPSSSNSQSKSNMATPGTQPKQEEKPKRNAESGGIVVLDDSDDEDIPGNIAGTPTKPVRAALENTVLSTSKKRRRRNSSQTSTLSKRSKSGSPSKRGPTNTEMIETLRSRGHAIPQGSNKAKLIEMLQLPAYPELIIQRKIAKRWVPRDSK